MFEMIKEILAIKFSLYTSVCQSIQIVFKTYIHRHSKMNFSFHRAYKITQVKNNCEIHTLYKLHFRFNNFRPSNMNRRTKYKENQTIDKSRL